MQIFIVKEGSNLSKYIDLIGSKNLPGLTNSIARAANYVQNTWVNTINDSDAKDGWKPYYVNAISQTVNTGRSNSADFSVTVSARRTKYVNFIEDGIKRFDMKEGLLKGPKARVNSKGELYNIVPFRHGTPGSNKNPMPVSIYKKAKKLGQTDINKRYRVLGIQNDKEKIYSKRPDRLKIDSKKDNIYAGMVKTGGKGHSQYLTFRVVSKNSKGWTFPGIPAVKIFDEVGRKIKPEVKRILQEGLIQDIIGGVNFLKSKGF